MAEAATTLVSVETKSGNNSRGAWTVYKFTDAAGNKYSTFDAALGGAAQALLNQSVVVSFDQEEKGKKLTGVKDAVAFAEAIPAGTPPAAPQPVSGPPATSQGHPDDVAGKIRTYIAGGLAGALFQTLDPEDQNFENAKKIGDKLVQWCLGNQIPF